MTNIHKYRNTQALNSLGKNSEAIIYSMLETIAGEASFIHYLLDVAERENDSELEACLFAMITNITGRSFNPLMLLK